MRATADQEKADRLEGRAIEQYRRHRAVFRDLADAVRRAEARERLELCLRLTPPDRPLL